MAKSEGQKPRRGQLLELRAAASYAAKDSARPILQYLYVTEEGKGKSPKAIRRGEKRRNVLVAADGYGMYVGATILPTGFYAAATVLSGAKGTVDYGYAVQDDLVTLGKSELTITPAKSLHVGTYPNFRNLLPDPKALRYVELPRLAMLAVASAALAVQKADKEQTPIIRMVGDKKGLTMRCQATGLECRVPGKRLDGRKVAVHADYLLRAALAFDTPTVRLGLPDSPGSAMTFTVGDALILQMPMIVQWDDGPVNVKPAAVTATVAPMEQEKEAA